MVGKLMLRLPSITMLQNMPGQNRHEVLWIFAKEAREEIDGVSAGSIVVMGCTKRQALANARRRLKRVDRAALHFGLDVGSLPPYF